MTKEKENIINVFKFSVAQIVKNKVFIILTLMCAVLMLVLTPIMVYMSGEFSRKDTTSIKKVYIIDENGILNNTKVFSKEGKKIKEFGKIKWYLINEKFEVYKSQFLKDKDNKTSLLVQATVDKSSYLVNIYKQEDCNITDTDLSKFSEQIVKFYNDNKIKNMQLDNKSYDLVNTPINVKVDKTGEDNNHESEIAVLSILIMVIMFFLVLSGENIATQIVTEKSTKLVEYLLVNVHPFDLVCGKILASVVVSFIQMLTMICAGLFSIVFCKKQGLIKSYEETLSLFKINEIVGEVSGGDVILIILFLVMGFLFYAILACMLASTVSRLEDLSSATMMYSVITIISVYTIMLIHVFVESSGAINNVLAILPFTSVFVCPSYIILGKLNIVICIISILVQILCVVLMGFIAAKVYITLIMDSGKKVTFRQVINIFRKNKVGEVYE